MIEERDYYLPFSSFVGIGPAKFKKLLSEFGSAKSVWSTKQTSLKKILGEKLSSKLEEFRKEFSIEKYLDNLKRKDVWFVTLEDKDYPKILKQIKNPPFVLYGRGNPSSLRFSGPSVAVVGARKTTQYGRDVTKLLTSELVANGFTIVSGLALGVDAISHMTALENNGATIAVLGCGVDCCTPSENQSIYNSILKSGNFVVSEFPLGMAPTKWTFPARNRIIAGLSQAVLVTEGAEDSGSLITAEFARKFGRKVFAVPGPITSAMSKGPYKLIQKGAKLATSIEDILNELRIPNSKFQIPNKLQIIKFKTECREEQIILKLLENEPLLFDEIVRKTKINTSKASSLLSMMEIKGFIKSLDSGMFAISH